MVYLIVNSMTCIFTRGGYYYAMYGADIVARLRPKYQQKFPKNPLS